MKKLMMAAAVAAMVFGAKAGTDTWTFQLTVKNYPTTGFDPEKPTGVYIFNKKTSTVIAYTTQADFPTGQGDKGYWQMNEPAPHTGTSVDIGNVPYDNNSHEIDAGSTLKANNVHDGVADLVFNFSTTLDNALLYGPNEKFDAGTDDDPWQDLAFVLYDGTADKTFTYDFEQFTMSNAHGATMESTYNPIPEPTSGLLMLLGMAGLALKRKSVA